MKVVENGVERDATSEEIGEAEARAEAWANHIPEESELPVPRIHAVAQLTVANGDISGIDVYSKFLAAFYLDVGFYYLFFANTQIDTRYIARGDSPEATIRVVERATDYIAISATDATGTPVDPAEFSIEIIRVS